jgi:hypothetical protein
MKKSYFIVALSLLTLSFSYSPVLAQDAEKKEFNTKKTEVNIAIANIFAKNDLFYSYYFFDGDNILNYFSGQYIPRPELQVGIKLHSDKGAFRIGTNFQFYTENIENQSGSTEKIKLSDFGFKLNLGYEWDLTYNRVVVYYGADLSTAFSTSNITQEYNNTTQESTLNDFGLGINPFLGVNCFITPNLSIGTEVKFTAEYVTGKSTNTNSSFTSNGEEKLSGFRTYFGPLGFLSINIYF